MSERVRVTAGWVASVVNGSLIEGGPEAELGELSTDTRSLQSGAFFVALRGPTFDGERFAGEAMARGACGAMVGTGYAGPRWGAIVQAEDTTRALQDLARAVRTASGARVVAITGSAGKTTTKEAIAAMLGGRYRVVKNKGNLNNHIGLPLSLMQLRHGPDVAVMELGMNHPGEIRRLVDIAMPDVRVWTNVGDAHVGFFRSVEGIADAKAEILEGAGAPTVLVCGGDDPRVMSRAARFPGRRITFGLGASVDVRAVDVVDRGIGGMQATVRTSRGEQAVETRLLGRGNLLNVLAGMATGLAFDVPLAEMAQAARQLAPADRRGVVHRLPNQVTVVDDSYNSSPSALTQALDVLAGTHGATRTIAVLGEMLELGEHSLELHRRCGRAAAESGLALLVTVGGEPALAMGAAALEAGMEQGAVIHRDTSAAAADALLPILQPGDLVFVKGSRGVRTDVVVDRITAERS